MNNEYTGMQANPVSAPEKNIGIDSDNELINNIVNMVQSGHTDVAPIQAFTQLAQERNRTYDLIDAMAEDSTISAVLETYAEDCTEYNDQGKVVWCESPDGNVLSYVNFLLDTLRVDVNIYKWVYRLCKDGDIYLRLYRESVINPHDNERKKTLNEQVFVQGVQPGDSFAHYIELVPNPASMFELVKYGKTEGYIEADVSLITRDNSPMYYSDYRYKFAKNDVHVYPPTEFVHASLDEDVSRNPEIITLFDDSEMKSEGQTYTVKRGKSVLYKAYRNWRQLLLLENSVLLNRLTKSSLLRVVNVEVGDMPKENVRTHLAGIKALFEQKLAFNQNSSIDEYTAPGPLENTIYVPTHNGQGTLSTQEIGGDVDVKSLADLDYFQNKVYGAVRIPKQFLNSTDDSTGFNGGTSLSIISSRYAKAIKRIQNTVLQCLTNAVNVILLDKGLDSYVNKFTLRMVAPTTQEQLDKIEVQNSKLGMVSDIMGLIGSDIEDTEARLTIMKSLLSSTIENEDLTNILQQEIDKLAGTPEKEISEDDYPEDTVESDKEAPATLSTPDDPSAELPTIEDIGLDLTNNDQEI